MIRWLSLVAFFAVAQVGLTQNNVLKIDVAPVKFQEANLPLTIPLSVPKAWAEINEVEIVGQAAVDGRPMLVGQLTAPGLVTESIKPTKDGLVRRDLHIILPAECRSLEVTFKPSKPRLVRFAWTEKKGEYEELGLTLSGPITPFLRYMNRPYDATSKDARDKSYKVFHHLYDPAGKRFVTNGGHTDENSADPKRKMLYPHHRGIMYGFNKCSYGDGLKKKADTWHCTGDAHVRHEKTLSREAGPVLGRHRVVLGWYGEKNERFAEEERELTVYNVLGGTLVEFASRLKTTSGKIKVDGDPQHAGFQFRAHNDVAAVTSNQTYYLHPDGSKGEMGKERNWPQDKAMVDLPWYVVSFVLGKERYSAVYLNHPQNPKETRFSERSYARFGGYFEREITEQMPLVVNYRLWLQTGEMTAEQANALRATFASSPKTVVK